MNSQQIALLRLRQQQLIQPTFTQAADLVRWMGCMQAQDYAGAKWAIGMRVKGSTDASIEAALQEGTILRTHILRPTWHFVSPEDIRWILSLTAPRIKAFNKNLHARLGITDKDLHRSSQVLGKALAGQSLARTALVPLLHKARIDTDDIRLGFHLMHAELEGIICSGPRQGKQFTYALLDDRAAPVAAISREEAITRLTLRYFRSRGPATVNDFQWWSGLRMQDIKMGLEENKDLLTAFIANGQAYWFDAAMPMKTMATGPLLLPAYDEYTVAYKDRSDVLPASLITATGYGIYKPTVVNKGQIAGTWSRKISHHHLEIDTQLPAGPLRALPRAIAAYRSFMGKADKFG
ncbi:winged helix DNA-binding domain-containing protein [Chitinophaga eiseniae]|uniref:Winged helix DNA-binding domain-containing protein n=1 Tax=Chitinophaga eiseniae TaxID=634771 RepID=A0A847SWJ3_9BACT|nr:winged helix DNA-binding domain-containing protein [Chitinophaga eiseniae]NLR81462.1 winged helix DNA-binding domain-containing protein [Chitinophaga eiseniae]